jgi:hypothetical protein
MTVKIPTEYNELFDFGFTAVESEESIVEKPVVNTAPMVDGLSAVEDKVSIILNKIDYLEEIIKAGAGANNNFDIDAYKLLVEKDVNDKLKKVEALIMPLLANLLKNPEKDFIKWPNRKPIIEAQISKLLAITRPPEG